MGPHLVRPLKLDEMAKTVEHQAALNAHYKTVSPEYRKQVGKFAALPTPTDPAQQLDVNNSVLSNVSETSSVRTTGSDSYKQFKLKAKDPPTFTRDVLDYRYWKNIWMTHVIPMNHDSWVIKALAEEYLKLDDPLIARKVKSMMTTKDVIVYLDRIFAFTKSSKKSGTSIKLHHRDATEISDFSESDSANGEVTRDEENKVNDRSSRVSPYPKTSRGGGSGSSPKDKIKTTAVIRRLVQMTRSVVVLTITLCGTMLRVCQSQNKVNFACPPSQ